MVDIIKNEKLEDVEKGLKRTSNRMFTLFLMHNIFGVTQMVFGWFVYDFYHSYAVFYDRDKFGRDITVSVLCSFMGLTFLINTFYGYIGSIKRNLGLITVCGYILLFLCIISVIYICMAFKVNLEVLLLCKNRQIPVWKIKDHEIRAAVDFVQTKLGCCGSSNYVDYIHLDFPNITIVEVVTPFRDNTSMYVPLSCCMIPENSTLITSCRSLGCRDEYFNTIVHFSLANGLAGLIVLLLTFSSMLYLQILARNMAKMKRKKSQIIEETKNQGMTKTLITKVPKAVDTHGNDTTDKISIDLKIPALT